MQLTIAYFTSRQNPRIEWFFSSLAAQVQPGDSIRIVVVDFWAQPMEFHGWTEKDVKKRGDSWCLAFSREFGRAKRDVAASLRITPPKPTVWQGRHRLTNRDYFAASNSRNTAIALCSTDWIACVDDLSVLCPGWLDSVRAAMAGGYVALGSYKKVKNLQVDAHGDYTCEEFPPGVDSRWSSGGPQPVVAGGSWMFGCSFATPIQAFLDINGFDEDADSMSGEDYIAGMMIERAGYQMRYVRTMQTLESEEAHYEEAPFLRIIKKGPAFEERFPRPQGKMGEWDASHWILDEVMSGRRNRAPNYFGESGLAGLRERVLAGEEFPVMEIPSHDWRDGQALRDM
jgi:hypothetical protein